MEEKRLFYSRPEVTRDYDRLRFGGPSGEWVNRRELSLVKSLLPIQGRILDLGCGTGRLSLHLQDAGYDVMGLDSSLEMLGVARAKPRGARVSWLHGNAFALPVKPAAFDGVVALRLAFHFSELRGLLTEALGVTKPGGSIVLDTYNWSPRAYAPLGRQTWGSRVYAHRPSQVIDEAAELGLEVVERKECFLFSPYVYRLLPLAVGRALERLESHLPDRLKARVFWRLKLPA